uniref:Uncharacterized protein n=1 Tax=Rhizophora mucronata TaxID=61149 RepID=A0A2P2QN83_RHIMU
MIHVSNLDMACFQSRAPTARKFSVCWHISTRQQVAETKRQGIHHIEIYTKSN